MERFTQLKRNTPGIASRPLIPPAPPLKSVTNHGPQVTNHALLIHATGNKSPQILNKNAVFPFLPYGKQQSKILCYVRLAFAHRVRKARNFTPAQPRYHASRHLVRMFVAIPGDRFAVKYAAIRKIAILANVVPFVATAGCNSQQASSATAIPAPASQARSAPPSPVDIADAGS